ncbi:MAG: Calx-beta domain-containing protein, partial [Planctomycetota bacterium]
MLSGLFCLAAVFALPTGALAELFDDFSAEQTGSWAPARWWDDYARRGRFIVPGGRAPKLNVAFSRGRREKEIIAAGGFVVEVDVLEIMGSAAICIGSQEFEEKGIAVVLAGDQSSERDKLYLNGRAFEIDGNYEAGQRVRIEVDTKDFEKATQGRISVQFGRVEVVSDKEFEWKKSPLGFHLAAQKGRAVFDNLSIGPAQPTIEFAQSASAGSEQQSRVLVDVVLEHPEQDQKYSVDYSVSSEAARSRSVDYRLGEGTVNFLPGETKKSITMVVNDDRTRASDEVVEFKLANPRGRNVQLGSKTRHSHTIVGEYPLVQFEKSSVLTGEGSGDVRLNVMLSHPCGESVTVDYRVRGRTAKAGADYKASAGSIVFSPGETSKQITVTVLDDTESENSINEVVVLKLRNLQKCVLGQNKRVRVEIVDDEPGIMFDGSIWMCTYDKHTKMKGQNVLSVNKAGQLEWISTYGDLLLTKLPQKSVSKVGDVAEYKWLYKDEGQAKGSYVENIMERYGSGDLRLAMLDSNGNPLSMDKQYARNDKIFCGYKGYQARLSPHVPTNQRADKWAIRVNPNGDNCHSPVDWGGCWGFPKYFNGHGVPVGEFSPIIITLERTAEGTIAFSVTLNNEKHTYVDKDKSPHASDKEKMESLYGEGSYNVVVVPGYQPRNIDTMAIYFANQRPFERITFARVE